MLINKLIAKQEESPVAKKAPAAKKAPNNPERLDEKNRHALYVLHSINTDMGLGLSNADLAKYVRFPSGKVCTRQNVQQQILAMSARGGVSARPKVTGRPPIYDDAFRERIGVI